MLSHLNLQLMTWSYLCDFDHITDGDALLHLGPQSHAAGLMSLSFIAKGANNVLPVSGGVDASEIALLINQYENLTFFAAPTMTRRLVDSPDIARMRYRACPFNCWRRRAILRVRCEARYRGVRFPFH